ncbi:MAG: cytochrome ubiquinol oxidase subunit I [Simkania negevensis]|nr:cytochrome ubiquinol oxidase subunit I [Simkania negevensis]
MDIVLLSRIQFALNIGFHYLYPPLSIGISLMIVIMEGLYVKTRKAVYLTMTKFWVKIFALTFALGIATGLVQVFSFGNNWARYSRFVGDVFGSALAAEGIFAFFLEAGFIGLMLFGWKKVSAKVHYLSSVLVAVGAHFSAIWIVAANSWMQTPAGFKIIGEGSAARAVITNFWEVIFNPSFLDRLTHVIIGCWLTGSYMLISVSAYYLLKKREEGIARFGMKLGLISSTILLIFQLISADSTARGVAQNQPEKFAAMEGVYVTEKYTGMNLIGVADSKTKEVKSLKIPGLLSFLVHRDFVTPVQGLDSFPESDWPNVPLVFQSYHLMIYMWGLMLLGVLLGWIFWWRGSLTKAKWTLRFLVVSIAFPYISNQAGWFTAEVGRQPWIVYRLLRTTEGVSRSISTSQVKASIIMFILIYLLLFTLFIFLLNRKIQDGPERRKKGDLIYRDPYQLF